MTKMYTEKQLRKFARQKEKRAAKKAAKALEPEPVRITERTNFDWVGNPTPMDQPPWETDV